MKMEFSNLIMPSRILFYRKIVKVESNAKELVQFCIAETHPINIAKVVQHKKFMCGLFRC